MDKIDREEAIEALKSLEKEAKALFWEYDPFEKHTKFEKLAFGYLIGLVQDLGAILDQYFQDCEETTGKWLYIGEFTDIDGNHHEAWKCDCCGFISYDDSNFCPQCGAKMENDNE